MPANTPAGTILVVRNVVDAESFAFSKSDTYLFLSEIPSGGTVLKLPANPSNGETYEFRDTDGSCGTASPITLESAGDATVGGLDSLPLQAAFISGSVAYDGHANNWTLSAGTPAFPSAPLLPIAGPIQALGSSLVSMPDNITVTFSDAFLAAGCLFTPKVSGKVVVASNINANVNAADILVLDIVTVRGATGFTGGTLSNGARYATGLTGPGLLTVVGGDAPVFQNAAAIGTAPLSETSNFANAQLVVALELDVGVPYAIYAQTFTFGGNEMTFSSVAYVAYELSQRYITI